MVREKPPKKQKLEYIYVVAFYGYYKIGRSRNVSRRIRTLIPTLFPETPRLIMSEEVPDCVRAERKLHSDYSVKRVHGEWFSLNETDLIEIRQKIVDMRQEPSCDCALYSGGPPRLCPTAARLRREMGNLSDWPTPPTASEFKQLSYVQHFLGK